MQGEPPPVGVIVLDETFHRKRLGETLAMLGVLAAVGVALAILFVVVYPSQVQGERRSALLATVRMAALLIDGDAHDKLAGLAGQNTPEYGQIKQTLNRIMRANPEIHFAYTMRQDEEGRIVCGVDADYETSESSNLGDVFEVVGATLRSQFATLDVPIIENEAYTDAWGTFLSAYAPIRASDGRRVGVLGLDLSLGTLRKAEHQRLRHHLLPFGALLGAIVLALAILFARIRRLNTQIRDLTRQTHDARKAAESALKESENKYRALFEESRDAVLILNEAGIVLDCNRSAARMFRCADRQELIRSHPEKWSPPQQPAGQNSRELINYMVRQTLTADSRHFDWIFRRTDGEEFPVSVLLTSVTGGQGCLLFAVCREITEYKQVEKDLRSALEELEHYTHTMTGREERVLELKQEVNAILKAAGRPEKYKMDFDLGSGPAPLGRVGE